MSDDLITWTNILTSTSTSWVTYNIPAAYRFKKYWKRENASTSANGGYLYDFGTAVPSDNPNNIHFDVAPSDGSVITADYDTQVVAKDENNVFDFSFTIQLGEYTPE